MSYYSKTFYPSDGAILQYQIKFGYLDKAHVYARVGDTQISFTWINNSIIELSTAPEVGMIIEVYRDTPKERMVDYNDGSFMIEESLDLDGLQQNYIAQEAIDIANLSKSISTGNSAVADEALVTANEAKSESAQAANDATMARGTANLAYDASIETNYNVAQMESTLEIAVENVNYAVDSVAAKVNTTGDNIERLPFLNALGISPDGEVDFSDFALTSATNIDTVAFRNELGVDELENNVSTLSMAAANTGATNIDTVAWQTELGIADLENEIDTINNTLPSLANTGGTNISVVSFKNVLGVNNIESDIESVNSTLPTLANTSGTNIDVANYSTILGLDDMESIPAGMLAYFCMDAPPDGWLVCNGATIGRVAYAKLFAKIGTLYGVGDGSTTFALPDLRGYFVRSYDGGRGIDTSRIFASIQDDANKSHTHRYNTFNYISNSNYAYSGTFSIPSNDVSALTLAAYTDASGSSETRPKNIALLPCISY